MQQTSCVSLNSIGSDRVCRSYFAVRHGNNSRHTRGPKYAHYEDVIAVLCSNNGSHVFAHRGNLTYFQPNANESSISNPLVFGLHQGSNSEFAEIDVTVQSPHVWHWSQQRRRFAAPVPLLVLSPN